MAGTGRDQAGALTPGIWCFHEGVELVDKLSSLGAYVGQHLSVDGDRKVHWG